MNLLTDIIRDVASEMGMKLTDAELIQEQNDLLKTLTSNLGWMKHKQLMKEGMPWLDKAKASNG